MIRFEAQKMVIGSALVQKNACAGVHKPPPTHHLGHGFRANGTFTHRFSKYPIVSPHMGSRGHLSHKQFSYIYMYTISTHWLHQRAYQRKHTLKPTRRWDYDSGEKSCQIFSRRPLYISTKTHNSWPPYSPERNTSVYFLLN